MSIALLAVRFRQRLGEPAVVGRAARLVTGIPQEPEPELQPGIDRLLGLPGC